MWHRQEMSTLIKSATGWFSDYHKRWLTSLESLTCQGFPIDKELSYDVPCCSWAMRSAGLSNVPLGGRSVTIGQAGNSMHTEVAATMISFVLCELAMESNAVAMFRLGYFRVAGNLQPSSSQPSARPAIDEDADNTDASVVDHSELKLRWNRTHTRKKL